MKRLAMSALAVAAMATFGVGTAHADPPDIVAGFTCGFSSVTDPQNQGNQTGEVDSHFAVFDTPNVDPGDPPNTLPSVGPNENPSHGHIECRFQTGPSFTNTGTILQTVTSDEQNVYVDLTTTVSYPEPTGDVYICTTWYAGDSTVSASGDTRYISDDTSGELRSGSEITGTETCALAISQEVDSSPVDGLFCGLFETVENTVPVVGPAVGEALEDTVWGCLPADD